MNVDDDRINETKSMEADLDMIMMAKKEGEEILCRAILGKNLHDVYSNARAKLAVNRQSMEQLNRELMGVDVMEVFSPERVGKFCKEHGLDQGKAMDLKRGYDFDKTSCRRSAGMP